MIILTFFYQCHKISQTSLPFSKNMSQILELGGDYLCLILLICWVSPTLLDQRQELTVFHPIVLKPKKHFLGMEVEIEMAQGQ